MVRLPDVTEEVPARRMSVARGTLLLPVGRIPSAEAQHAARAAAVMAAKEATRILPTAVPFQLTDVYCDIDAQSAHTECTVTVQGYGRTVLSSAALLGAAAALATLAEAEGHPDGTRVAELHVVQNVKS
jgi:molybdenum cofactor biosynthesis enzyme